MHCECDLIGSECLDERDLGVILLVFIDVGVFVFRNLIREILLT